MKLHQGIMIKNDLYHLNYEDSTLCNKLNDASLCSPIVVLKWALRLVGHLK